MVHGKKRIPYWIDRRLTGLAGPDNDATISFGLPFESEDCPYGKSRIKSALTLTLFFIMLTPLTVRDAEVSHLLIELHAL